MKKLLNVAVLSLAALAFCASPAVSQDRPDERRSEERHDNHTYVKHEEWRKGEHIRHEDWDRGERVDYRQYHLAAPPRGYEWRLIDGNYVLAAPSGEIHTIVIAR